jgi:hypothetical protein
MRSAMSALLKARGPGATVREIQDEELARFEDGLLKKEAHIREKLRHNVERIKEVERELANFRRDMALTSGSKKLALEHLRRRIDAQSERYTEAERRKREAQEELARAEADADKERVAHERLVRDLQVLMEQKSQQQEDRMRELTQRLEELSNAADVAGPRGTAERVAARVAETDDAPARPAPGFSFAPDVDDDDDRDLNPRVETAPPSASNVANEYEGWEGDVMYDDGGANGSGSVVGWEALAAGEEARKAAAVRDALGAARRGRGKGMGADDAVGKGHHDRNRERRKDGNRPRVARVADAAENLTVVPTATGGFTAVVAVDGRDGRVRSGGGGERG